MKNLTRRMDQKDRLHMEALELALIELEPLKEGCLSAQRATQDQLLANLKGDPDLGAMVEDVLEEEGFAAWDRIKEGIRKLDLEPDHWAVRALEDLARDEGRLEGLELAELRLGHEKKHLANRGRA